MALKASSNALATVEWDCLPADSMQGRYFPRLDLMEFDDEVHALIFSN